MSIDLSSIETRRRIADVVGLPETTLRGWWSRGGTIPAKYFPKLVDAGLATPDDLVEAVRRSTEQKTETAA
jgi:hypothetical protein